MLRDYASVLFCLFVIDSQSRSLLNINLKSWKEGSGEKEMLSA